MTDIEKLAQIKNEYSEGRDFSEQRKIRQANQLALMNNLNRGDENIAATTLFSFFNRVFSGLYEPKKQIKFVPGQESELGKIEMLNKLSDNDFQEMMMELIEYDWTWDACFFSEGYVETLNFDKKRKMMIPEVINPLMLIRDPMIDEVQQWRYYGKWITRSSSQINTLIQKGIIKNIKDAKEITTGFDPEIWNYKVIREQAKYVTPQGPDSTTTQSIVNGNGIHQIFEHYTHFDGVRTVVWTNREMTRILREKELDLKDREDGKSKWPIIKRTIFREPHSTVTYSVPDLIEDKHRAKSVLMNLMLIAAKDEVTPMYEYDSSIVQDTSVFQQRQILQHIEVKGGVGKGVAPVRKQVSFTQSAAGFINLLDNESANAIGTVQVTPSIQKGKKSATGDALMQQVADLTGSLQSRVIGASEKEFWSHWYQRYIHNMSDADEKILSVTNSQFTTFESIKLDNIRTDFPPKIMVFSAKDAQFTQTVERRELAQQFPMLQEVLSPDKMVQFLKFIWFPKFETFDSETLDLIFPKTFDEIKAEQENELLIKDKLPSISETDDHQMHLLIHARAKNTRSKWAHYLTHETLLAKQQKDAQQKQAQDQQDGADNKGGKDQKKPGMEKMNSKDNTSNEAVTPLKTVNSKQVKESKLATQGNR